QAANAAASPTASPTFLVEHSTEGIMQKFATRPSGDVVRVNVPPSSEASCIFGGATGNSYMVQIIDRQRVVTMARKDACALLLSPFSSPTWAVANWELAESLRSPKFGGPV